MTIHHAAAVPGDADPDGIGPEYPTVTTAGTLAVLVPKVAWRCMARQARPDPALLAARVHTFIQTVLIPQANNLMAAVCPGCHGHVHPRTRSTPDPTPTGTGFAPTAA